MPIDTSSYYPETDSDSGYSLNNRNKGLFGDETSDIEKKEIEEKGDNNKKEENCQPPKRDGKLKEDPEGIEKGITVVSNILSWVLVPLFMPVYGLIFAFGLSMLDVIPMSMRVRFVFIIAGINCLIPALLVALLKLLGYVNDIGLNGQRERLIPYMITIICMGASSWFMAIKGAPLWLCMFYVGGAVAGLINFIINFKWKISAHAAGIAGIIALLIRMEKVTVVEPQLFTWLIIVIGLTGLLGSSRVWLGRHTVWQVLAGYVVGFCSVFFLMAI